MNALGALAKQHALSQKRWERIADVGKAENQPVSVEVMEVAEEEIARLQRDVQRLQTWYDNLKAATAEKDDTLQSQSERIGDLVADVSRLEGEIQTQQAQVDGLQRQNENQETTIRVQAETIGRLENTPQNPLICSKEPPLTPETAEPVGVHPAPNVRRAGGK